jgi:Mrp family chromosome partitioning ATPase
MIPENSSQAGFPRVIVVANEKGGSGKSTVAIHIAIALLKSGASVATIDLDSRQSTFPTISRTGAPGPSGLVATSASESYLS